MIKNKRITLYCIVTSLYWFSLYAYVPTLSPYAESLGASHRMVGLIVGSYGFTQMLIRIPLGILSDTINKRKIFIVTGMILALVSSLGFWYYPNANAVLVFRALSGASAATWVIYTVLFSSYYNTEDTPKAIGLINAYNAIGQMSAMMIGGLAAQHFGQQAPFAVAAIGGIIGMALSLGVVEKKSTHKHLLKAKELLIVGKDRLLILVSALAILSQLVTFATVYGFTPVIAKEIGANSFQLGMLTTLSILPGIFAAAMSGGVFSKKYGEKRIIVVGFILTTITSVIIPYITNINILYLSQIVGGFGRGLVFPLLMGLSIKTIDRHKRATAMGFFQAIYGIGMFLGPVMVGFLSDTVGLTWGFWTTGATGIIGAILAGLYIRT